jgi:predicted DNA-binding transcriptional regulator AlpA
MVHIDATAELAGSGDRPDRDPVLVCVHELMTSAEVAALLRVSPATLCRWRERGVGPRALWLSPRMPRYSWHDVQQWMERSRS